MDFTDVFLKWRFWVLTFFIFVYFTLVRWRFIFFNGFFDFILNLFLSLIVSFILATLVFGILFALEFFFIHFKMERYIMKGLDK